MKSLFIQILFVFFTLGVNAQIDFTENVIIDDTFGANNPSKVLTADIDGDGFKDVVSLANGIYWYKNIDGQGNFDKPILIEYIYIAGLEYDIDIADLDGDNDLDLVYFIRNPNDVNAPILVWAENLDGLGNFSESQFLNLLTDIGRLKVDLLDVDNDGDVDITYSDYEEIGWMENNNSGNFINHTLLTIPSNLNFDGYDFSDFNGDNRLDLVVDYQSTLTYYVHNPNNTVTTVQNLDFSSNGRYVIAADIDADGDNDIARISLDGIDSAILWYENIDGLGLFAASAIIVDLPEIASANINTISDINFIDIDGDNMLDLFFSFQPNNKVSWYKNLGSVNFGDEQVITDTAMGVKSFTLADINNDTSLDIITSSVNDNQVGWYNNLDGQGDFSQLNLISRRVQWMTDFDKGDLDRDGDLDIVTVSEDGKLSLFENTDGQGNFEIGQIVIDNTLNQAQKVLISDVDNDEDLDVIVWAYEDVFFSETSIWLFTNDGNLNFLKSNVLSYGEGIEHVKFSDYDGDYDLDVIGVQGGSSIFYLTNNGDGTFEDMQIMVDNLVSVTALAIDDIDNDNDVDIAIGEYGGDVSWYNNSDGLGSFIFAQKIEGNSNSVSEIIIEDITNNGYKDIVFSGYEGSTSKIEYLNNTDGNGAFVYEEVIVTFDGYFSTFFLMDFDNDRDIDILAGTNDISSQTNFVWYENFGNINPNEITFGTGVTINNESVSDVQLFDIDNNGSLDLVVSENSDSLIWFQNFSFSWNEIIGTVTFADVTIPCDENNPPLGNAMVIADNGINQYATFTGFNGFYQLLIEEPGDYVTSFSTQFPDYFEVNPSSYSSNFDDLGNTENFDFCVEQTAEIVYDLELSIIPFIDDPRPGFDTSYKIVYTNKGPFPESGAITFEYEGSKLQFQNATETVENLTASEVVFNFEDLNPFETRFIDVTFTVFQPPIVNSGDLLDFFATADGGNEDVTPVNNSHGIKQFVVNSYDPNDIRVMEGPEIFIEDAGNYLNYVIRFQNTGSASAININVEHQLDEKLDWASMELLSLSHAGRVDIIDGSMVNFVFDDIHLPDSTSNEPASHGYIAYKIKPKPNVVLGDIFSGVADIYFDFNPPIITNTVNTEIVEPLSVDEFDLNKVKLYPNPAKDILEVSSSLIISRLTLIDLNGRELTSVEISDTEYRFDISALSKGIYFLEIHSGNSKSTKKFIKN